MVNRKEISWLPEAWGKEAALRDGRLGMSRWELFGGTGRFYFLIWGVATQVYAYRKINGAEHGRFGHFGALSCTLSTHPQPHPHKIPGGSDPAAAGPCPRRKGHGPWRPLPSSLQPHFRASPRAGTAATSPGSAGPAPANPVWPPLYPGLGAGQGTRAPRPAGRPPGGPAPPRPRPRTAPPYLAPGRLPGEAAGGQGPRDVARSRARPHHVQQQQRPGPQGRRGAGGREPLGGAAGPDLPPHARGPAESGADGKSGAGLGSHGVAREGRGPGGDAPGGWRGRSPRSISPRACGRRIAVASQVGGRLPLGKLRVQPLLRGPRAPSFPSRPAAGPERLLVETTGRSSFSSSFLFRGRAASNPSRGWESRPGGGAEAANPPAACPVL